MSMFDDLVPGNKQTGMFEDLVPPEPSTASQVARRIPDLAVTGVKAAISVPESIVGLADLVTGGRAGKAVEEAGIGFKQTKEGLDTLYSDAQKKANAEVNEAKGFFPTVGAMVQNPSTILHAAIESVPSMLVGGAVGRGVMAAAGAKAGAVAGDALAEGAAAAVPRIGPTAAGAIGEGVVAAGQNAEQIRQQNPEGDLSLRQAAITALSGAATGGLSLAGGRIANKLGIGDVDTMITAGRAGAVGGEAVDAAARAAAEAAAKKGVLRKIGEGAVSEGVFEEMPQSYQEQIAQNLATDKPWDEGAAEAAAQGMLAGGLMGGGGNVLAHLGEKKVQTSNTDDTAPAAPPAAAPVDPAPAGPTLPPAGPMEKAASLVPQPEGGNKVFPFGDLALAQKQADSLSQSTGMPHEAGDHPTVPGRFAAQPVAIRGSDPLFTAEAERQGLDPAIAQLLTHGPQAQELVKAAMEANPGLDPQEWRDPAVRAQLGAAYLKRQVGELESALERPPTPAEAYIAQQVGVPTAASMLNTPEPERAIPVSTLIPDPAQEDRLGLTGMPIGAAIDFLTKQADQLLSTFKEQGNANLDTGVQGAGSADGGSRAGAGVGDGAGNAAVPGQPAAGTGADAAALPAAAGNAGNDPGNAGPVAAPRVVVGPSETGFQNVNAQRHRDKADALGVTGEIERLFGDGLTINQVMGQLQDKVPDVGRSDLPNFVNGVRASLGIPNPISPEGKGAFDQWRAQYKERLANPPAPSNAGAAKVTPEFIQPKNDIDLAAHDASNSPLNDRTPATPGQQDANNYKVGRTEIHGLKIGIENPKGSTRTGFDPDGKPWSTLMTGHYGRFTGTKGADGDAVDTFIGDNPESPKVFVVDQVDPKTGKFDEHKVLLGANSQQEASDLYHDNYAPGWKGAGAITETTPEVLKTWLKQGDTTSPFAKVAQPAVPAQNQPLEVDRPAPEETKAAAVKVQQAPYFEVDGRTYKVNSGTQGKESVWASLALPEGEQAPAGNFGQGLYEFVERDGQMYKVDPIGDNRSRLTPVSLRDEPISLQAQPAPAATTADDSRKPRDAAVSYAIYEATRAQEDRNRPAMDDEDADLHLEAMQTALERGKFSYDRFASSDLGQRMDTAALVGLKPWLDSDPAGTLQALRERIATRANANQAQGTAEPASAPVAQPAPTSPAERWKGATPDERATQLRDAGREDVADILNNDEWEDLPPRTQQSLSSLAAPPQPTAAPASSLADLLKNATRRSNIKGMEGEQVADPIAQQLLGSKKFDEFERAIADSGLQPTGVIGAGASSIVLDMGDKVLRLGTGPNVNVPRIAGVIQPIDSNEIGDLRYQVMPKADTSNITDEDVATVAKGLREQGYEFSDAGTDNVGRVNGKLVVIDPGAVREILPHDKPLAPEGSTSYRYKGPMGYVMIGADDHDGAMKEAARSLEKPPTIDNLQVWDGERYVPVDSTPAGTTTPAETAPATPEEAAAARRAAALPDALAALEDLRKLSDQAKQAKAKPGEQQWRTSYEYGSRVGKVEGYVKGEHGEDLVRFVPNDGSAPIDLSPHGLFPVLPDNAEAKPAAPSGDVHYPNRKLGFEKAKTDPADDYNDHAWANIAAANLQVGDEFELNGKQQRVESITGKTLKLKDAEGKTRTLNPNGVTWDQFKRDLGGQLTAENLQAKNPLAGKRPLIDILKRDPAVHVDDNGSVFMRDGGTAPGVKAAAPVAKAPAAPRTPAHELTREQYRKAEDRGQDGGIAAAKIKLDKLTPETLVAKHKDQVLNLGKLMGAKGGKNVKKVADDIIRLHKLSVELANETEESLLKLKAPALKALAKRVGVYSGGNKGDMAQSIIKKRDSLREGTLNRIQDIKHRQQVLKALQEGTSLPDAVVAEYAVDAVKYLERGSKQYQMAVEKVAQVYLMPPFSGVPKTIKELRDDAAAVDNARQAAVLRDVADAVERGLAILQGTPPVRDNEPDRAWHTTAFADRIRSMLVELRAAGKDGMASAIEAGMHSEAKAGRLDEAAVAFRELKARETLAATGTPGPAVIPKSAAQKQEQVHQYDLENATSLLLIACGDKKLPGRHRAIDLYKGALFEMLNKWKPEGNVEVYIISAKHGLVHADTMLDSYDEKMTLDRAEDLVDEGVSIKDFEGKNFKDVYIAGSAMYTRVGKAYADQLRAAGFVGPDAPVDATKGFIGQQRGQLGEYLRALGVAAAKTDPAKWTAAEAEAFIVENEDVFAEHGFVPRIVGGLRLKAGARKDADIVLDPMQPRTFEQAHAAIEQMVGKLGGEIVGEMLESADVPDSFFIGVNLPNGKYAEFVLEESAHPSEYSIEEGEAAQPTHALYERDNPKPPARQEKQPLSPRQRVRNADPFLALIAERGVALRVQADLGLEKGNRGNRMVPGYGPVLRHAGMNLDELAEAALAGGFISQADMDDPVDTGAVKKLSDLIYRAVAKREVIPALADVEQGAQQQAEQRAEAELRTQADAMGIAHGNMSADEVYDAVRERLADNLDVPLEVYDDIAEDADALQDDIRADEIDRALDAAFALQPQQQELTDEQLDQIFGPATQEARPGQAQGDVAGAPRAGTETAQGTADPQAAEPTAKLTPDDQGVLLWHGTTIKFLLDGKEREGRVSNKYTVENRQNGELIRVRYEPFQGKRNPQAGSTEIPESAVLGVTQASQWAPDAADFALSGQSLDEGRAAAAAEEARQAAEAKAEREAARREEADKERDTFTLVGSNRPADVLAAQGQTSIFDLPPAAPAPVAAPATATAPAEEAFIKGDLSPSEIARLKNPDTWTAGLPEGPERDLAIFNNVLGMKNKVLPGRLTLNALKGHVTTAQTKGGVAAWHFLDMVQRRISAADPKDQKKFNEEVKKRLAQADAPAPAVTGPADMISARGEPVAPMAVPKTLPSSPLIAKAIAHVDGEENFRRIAQAHLNDLAEAGFTVNKNELDHEMDLLAYDVLSKEYEGKEAKFADSINDENYPPLPGMENAGIDDPGMERLLSLFPPPPPMVNAVKKAAGERLTAAQAQARLDTWKAEAKRIGDTGKNAKKVVLSLFDSSGVWSQPYADAGYVVVRYDLNHGDNLVENFPMNDIVTLRAAGYEIVGVIAQPPCTSFSNAGRWSWPAQHQSPSKYFIEKKYGKWASKYFDTAIDAADTLGMVAQAVIEFAAPTEFYVLENPRGRIAERLQLPDARLVIQPHVYGNAYTKETFLYGEFNTDLPTANVSPKEEDGGEGSRIYKLRGTDAEEHAARSLTPEGFAYAWFMANHDRKAIAPRETPATTTAAAQTAKDEDADTAKRLRAIRNRIDDELRGDRQLVFEGFRDGGKRGGDLNHLYDEYVGRFKDTFKQALDGIADSLPPEDLRLMQERLAQPGYLERAASAFAEYGKTHEAGQYVLWQAAEKSAELDSAARTLSFEQFKDKATEVLLGEADQRRRNGRMADSILPLFDGDRLALPDSYYRSLQEHLAARPEPKPAQPAKRPTDFVRWDYIADLPGHIQLLDDARATLAADLDSTKLPKGMTLVQDRNSADSKLLVGDTLLGRQPTAWGKELDRPVLVKQIEREAQAARAFLAANPERSQPGYVPPGLAQMQTLAARSEAAAAQKQAEPAKPPEPAKLRGRDGKLTADIESVMQGHIDDGMTALREDGDAVVLSFPNDELMGMRVTDPKMVAFVKKAVADKLAEQAADARQPAWNALGERVDLLLPRQVGQSQPTEAAYQKVADALQVSLADARAAHDVYRFEESKVPAHEAPSVPGAAAPDALFSRAPSKYAREKMPLDQWRVLKRDHTQLQPEEKAAFDAFIKERPDGKRVLAQLNLHRGTPWARQALEGIFVRQAILTYIKGQAPAFQSMMEHPSAESLRSILGRHGYKGLMMRLEETGYVGEAEKPVHNVSSSFINCNPSDDCAKYCYATGGHYTRTFAVIKAELVTLAVEHDPVAAAKGTAKDFMRTWEYENNKALRLFDKGDGNADWLPYIKALNAEGVRVQIFSKNPEFLRQVPDMNLRLLSIDQTNLGLADANPDLPVAFVYDKSPGQIEFVAKLALRKQLAVVLPIQLGKRVLTKPELRELQALPGVSQHICPIDAGIRPLGTNTDSDPKAWNCTKCDVKGGIGCFFGAPTTAVKAQALRPADMTPQQVVAARIQELTKEFNEITEGITAPTGTARNLAATGPDAAARLQGLRGALDRLVGELLGHFVSGEETRDAGESGGGTERADSGVEAEPGRDRRTIPIAKARDKDGNPLASRGLAPADSLPLENLTGALDAITSGWANGPAGGVHGVASILDLPPSLLARIPNDALRDMRGVYDPATDAAYLIADRLENVREAQFVLGHEVLGHAGLRAIMDKTELASELNRLRMINPALGAAAREQASRFGYDLITATEEALADWQGEGRTINGWQRFVAKVQAALRAVGLDAVADWMENRSQAETLSLLSRAREAITGDNTLRTFGTMEALRYSSDRAPRWQSALAEQIGKMPTKVAPAAQWVNALAGLQAKGVKRDEIEWSGIKEWLQLQDGKVTKEQVLNFLSENGVKVDEVIKGEPDPQLEAKQQELARQKEEYVQQQIEEARKEHERRTESDVQDRMAEVFGSYYVSEAENDDGDTVWELHHEYGNEAIDTFETEEEAQAAADESNYDEQEEAERSLRRDIAEFDEDEARYYAEREFDNEHDEDLDNPADAPKFESWRTVPGGDPATYRELLITLDDIPGGQTQRRQAVFDKYAPEIAELRKEVDAAWASGKTALIQEAQSRYDKLSDKRNLEAKAAAGEIAMFSGDHWENGQVLAHVRFDIRTNPNGESVLQVHEIQSDWAEQGRSKGFHDDQARAVMAAYDAIEAQGGKKALRDRLRAVETAYEARTGQQAFVNSDPQPAFQDSAEGREWDRLSDILMEPTLAKKKVEGLAPAPFVKKTEAWVSLALKRVMTYAAEKGIDHVALPTADQVNEAFSLEKRVAIEYTHKPDGKVWLHVTKADNGNTVTERSVEPKELPGIVGKEVADKIMQKEGEEKYDPEGKQIKERGEPTGVFRGPDTHYGESWYISFTKAQPLGVYPNEVLARAAADGIRDMVREEHPRVLAGDDLKIGGDPMRKYYDGMVVNIANDLLKKFGGGRVQTMQFGRKGDMVKPVVEEFKGRYVVRNELTGRYFNDDVRNPTWVDAPAQVSYPANRYSTAESWAEQLAAHSPKYQPGFTMTPALKERASQGLPLFSRSPDADGSSREKAAPGANVQRLASLLGPQLYGDMSDMGPVTVKELYQNAFDALKGSLESGAVQHGQIDIKTDRDTRTITVSDNGAGMTPEIINKAFLTIAGTNKETTRSSGGFGIAKMLFLFGNKSLSLVTVRNGIEARLDTTGEQLMNAFTDPSAAPEIVTRPTDAPSGTSVTVTLPTSYNNPSTGREETIHFPSDRYDVGDTLTKSPLFENITVRFNGQELRAGAAFPNNDYTTFSTVKFDWGTARIIVSKVEQKGGWGANYHVLSNGLWQFSQSLKENPFSFGGDNVPREFYINVEPRVRPEEPGYPFALNRKGFSPAVADDFAKISKYLSVLYGANKAAEAAAGFGKIEYVDTDGAVSAPLQLAPKVDAGARESMLVINEGDQIEVHDGRMTVNGRVVPELSPDQLSQVKVDMSKFKIDQSEVDPTRPMIHDNVDVKLAPKEEAALAEARARIERLQAVKDAAELAYDDAAKTWDQMQSFDTGYEEQHQRVSAARAAFNAASNALWDARDGIHDLKDAYKKAIEAAETMPVTQAMRAQFGARFDRFAGDLGRQFMRLRDALIANDREYEKLARVPVGVSFDEDYYGVHTMVPFRGMFLNPAMTAVDDPDAAGPQASTKLIATAMVGTMIHEIAHFREMNHSERFIGEMQRVTAVLDSADNFNLANLKQEVRSILDRNHDIYTALNRTFRSDAVSNRGVKLADGSAYSARDNGSAEPVVRAGLPGQNGGRVATPAVDGPVDRANGGQRARADQAPAGARDLASDAPKFSRTAGWTTARVDRLLDSYAYTNATGKTKAYAAWITPQDYLALTASDMSRIAREATPLDEAKLAAQTQEVFLQVDDLPKGARQVTGHEGRHRVYAMMQAGVERFPVIVYSSVGTVLQPQATLRLNGQNFGHARAPGRHIALHDAVPVTYENRTTLETMFGKPGGYDTLLFSRATPQERAAAAGKAINALTVRKVTNKLADYRSIGLQMLGRLQLTDLYGDLFQRGGNQPNMMRTYSDLAARMDAEKTEGGSRADAIVDRWAKLKDERELAKLMHDATRLEIDPSKKYDYADNRRHYDELKARYDALSPEAVKIYREAADAYRTQYDAVRKAVRDRIERTVPSHPNRAAMISQLEGEFFKRKIKGVYFPLARFGDYLVQVRYVGLNPRPDQGFTNEAVSFAETLNEAEDLRKRLMKEYPAAQGYEVMPIIKRAEYNAGRDSVPREFLKKLFGALDDAGMKDPSLIDTINQLYLMSLPDLSWAKVGIHRTGLPGFSQDARRAFAHSMFHGSNYLAKLKYSDQLTDTLEAMQSHVTAHAIDDGYEQVKAQQVVDEMIKRHDAYLNPKGNKLSTFLTSAGFLFYLGLSPASAMTNLLQTPTVAYPILGGRFGYAKAAAALLEASKMAMKGHNDMSTLLTGGELLAYKEWVRTGLIDLTMVHDLAGVASGRDDALHGGARKFMKAASFMFHHAERFNRQSTALAAYRLARESGLNHDDAYLASVELTKAGHFDYAAGNRPRAMQGPVAQVVLLFKQYAQNLIYTFTRNGIKAFKGDKEAMRTFAGLLVTHAMAAGVLGLPAVSVLLAAASMAGGGDDDPWDAEVALRRLMADAFGEKAGEVLAHGLSRLTPWDMSGRLGADHLIFPDIQEGLQGERAFDAYMTGLLGPVVGIGVNMAKGMNQIADGQLLRGWETMMPSVVRGGLRAFRYATEGVKDREGIVLMPEVSAAEIGGQILGFGPGRPREKQEANSAIKSFDARIQRRRTDLVEEYARLVMKGEDLGPALAEISAFNEKHPSRVIAPFHLMASVRNRTRRIAQAGEQGMYLPPKRAIEAKQYGDFADERGED